MFLMKTQRKIGNVIQKLTVKQQDYNKNKVILVIQG